jgi:integrase
MGYIFHSKINSEGEQQVLYKFSYQAKPIIISTGIHVKKKNFIKLKGDSKSKLAKIESIILDSISEAKKNIPPSSPSDLKKLILLRVDGRPVKDGVARVRLKEAWDNLIDEFSEREKQESAEKNRQSMAIILPIFGNPYVDKITLEDLQELKKRLLALKRPPKRKDKSDEGWFYSPASVAGWLRDMRAAILRVVKESPFVGLGFPKAPKKKNIAMNLEEAGDFKKVEVLTRYEELVRDVSVLRIKWMGMRIKDLLFLKTFCFQNDRLTYFTHKGGKPRDFILTQYEIDIINKWKGPVYLFPFISDKITDSRELFEAKRNAISQMDKVLKRLAKRAGIKKKLTSHSMRHTYANINRHKGTDFIQGSFDHADPKTSQIYMETLDDQDEIKNNQVDF